MATDAELKSTPLFRDRLHAGEHLVGTFIKTPTLHAIEILGIVGFDFVVIDAEHAPFDRAVIDTLLFAAKACGVAGLVRVASPAPSEILSVLDCGATGVLVPHVSTAAKAREAAAACRYRGGKRGYSGSTRSNGYGGGAVWASVDREDKQATLIAMIEDPEALDEIDAIAAVEGVDAFFIGRGDLTVAFGAPSSSAPVVVDAVRRISAAARAVGKPVAVMVGGAEEAAQFKEMGASAYIVASDQGFMRKAASAALADMAKLKG